MRLTIYVLPATLLVSLACIPIPGTEALFGTNISQQTCEGISAEILEMSAGELKSSTAQIDDIREVEETNRTSTRLDCEGRALWQGGEESAITFHVGRTSNGDTFYGYEEVGVDMETVSCEEARAEVMVAMRRRTTPPMGQFQPSKMSVRCDARLIASTAGETLPGGMARRQASSSTSGVPLEDQSCLDTRR